MNDTHQRIGERRLFRRRSFFGSIAILLLLLVWACEIPGKPPRRGFILISVDTLRADHLGLYGYGKDTSPFLDSLADRAVVFENAFVQLPGTLPSHMSIFTGLYPAEHGVYPPDGALSATVLTLPEIFQANGYRTGGFTEGGYVHGGYGFSRGFDSFSHDVEHRPDDIERTFAKGVEFLEGLDTEESFFLFLHTYSVHDPYRPPKPFDRQFWDGERPDVFAPTGPEFTRFNKQGDRSAISTEALEYFKAQYDGGIRYMDLAMSRFFDRLAELGLEERVTVVITSDHGEEFLEHGLFVHEQIYRESLHVPLILLDPLAESRRVNTLVQSIDIAPTLYDLAGFEVDDLELSGKSLYPLMVGAAEEEGRIAYAEGFVHPSRALIQNSTHGLFSLIQHGSEKGGEPPWMTSSVEFDTTRTGLEFQAVSFFEPRELEIWDGDQRLYSAYIHPDRWTTVAIELGKPNDWRRRLTLKTAGCTVPAEVGKGRDNRCLSFRVKDIALLRSELFDLGRDRLQSNDLSLDEKELVRQSYRRMNELELVPRAQGEKGELTPELEERLLALGYLQ